MTQTLMATAEMLHEAIEYEQLNDSGQLRHLLKLEGLDKPTIIELLDRAHGYIRLAGRTVANLFFEASTCARASFELAVRMAILAAISASRAAS
jgi:aspartate carbamoyltransferase catalytic subunit